MTQYPKLAMALALLSPGLQAFGQLTLLSPNTQPSGISADGRVIGGRALTPNGTRAFLWSAAEGYREADSPAVSGGGVSGDGSTLVGGSPVGAYRWRGPGTFQPLGTLPPPFAGTSATGVSGDGSVVVGYAGNIFVGPTTGWYWSESTGIQQIHVTDGRAVGVSRNGAVVVGTTDFGFFRGFTWTPSGGERYLQSPDGVSVTYARAINFDGSIVVGNSNPTSAPTIWTNEAPMLLPVPAGWLNGFSPLCLNDNATVVAGVGGAGGDDVGAVVWTTSRGTERFGAYLTANGISFPSGFLFSTITGVSADGRTFTGTGGIAGEIGGGFVVTVPAPGSAALGLGAALIAIRRKRKALPESPC